MSLDVGTLHFWERLPWFRKPEPEAPPAAPVLTTYPIHLQVTEPATVTNTLPTTGAVLRRLRKARGLTQAEVSAITYALPGKRGISPSSVSAVELWHSNLEPATVESYLLAMEQWGA